MKKKKGEERLHHHLAPYVRVVGIVSRGWAKAENAATAASKLAYLAQSSARSCRFSMCPGRSLHRLAGLSGLPCRLFLLYGLHMVNREVHQSSLRRLMCPAQDHLNFLIFFPFWYVRPQVCSVLVW